MEIPSQLKQLKNHIKCIKSIFFLHNIVEIRNKRQRSLRDRNKMRWAVFLQAYCIERFPRWAQDKETINSLLEWRKLSLIFEKPQLLVFRVQHWRKESCIEKVLEIWPWSCLSLQESTDQQLSSLYIKELD